jgi:hypothetical protein
VWEPILATDWRSPGRSALARISDNRTKQFWDPEHLVAQELDRRARERQGQPAPDCCVEKGYFWDDAILYSSNLTWKQMPTAVFWNGPVVRQISNIEKALRNLSLANILSGANTFEISEIQENEKLG